MKSVYRIRWAMFSSLLFLSINSALAAGNLDVRKDITINMSGSEVWSVIADYCAIAAWHPAVTYCDKEGGNVPGTMRILTLNNGAELNEKLLRYDDDSWNYAYEIVDPTTTLPVMNYDSTIQVRDIGGGRSLVVWEGSFDSQAEVSDSDAVAAISGVYEGGLSTIKQIAEGMK